MKFLMMLLLSFFTTKLLAFPVSGDFVRFEADYKGHKVTLEKKILSHNQQTNIFTVRILQLFDQEIVQDQLVELPFSFLYTPEKINHVLETCHSREGALGEVRIQNQVIKMCEFYDESSQLTSILGMVPFGLIRFQQYLGEEEFLDFNLTKFTHGEGLSDRLISPDHQ